MCDTPEGISFGGGFVLSGVAVQKQRVIIIKKQKTTEVHGNMAENRCPLCGSTNCKFDDRSFEATLIDCKTFNLQIYLSREFYDDYRGSAVWNNSLNIIVEKIVKCPKAPNKANWVFYYSEHKKEVFSNDGYYNLYNDLNNYPETVSDTANRVLLNISRRYPRYSNYFRFEPCEYRLYFPQELAHDATGMIRLLCDFGYLQQIEKDLCAISVDGWKRIEELKKQDSTIKQGFIAMQFGDTTNSIREAFREAINTSGYDTCIIDEKEHNNQIVPEIFFEIRRSKFVVVDVTYPNHGAYYEAGFAQGLGKEVIVCCKKDVFYNESGKYVRPHFDISQKSMVVWENEADLVVRLKKRIEATVG